MKRLFGKTKCIVLASRLLPTVALLLFVPITAVAEGITLVRTVAMANQEPVESKKLAKKQLSLGLDENGDVTIYYQRVSLTMSYNPADLAPQPRERVALSLSPEAPAVGGMGVKVGFAF